MLRRHFLRTSALTAGILALPAKRSFSFFPDPAYKITMLTDDLGIFNEKGGTIAFLLSKDGIVVVDSEFPEQSAHLITELRTRSDKPYRLLINTHHHGDHTAGNISFKGIVPHVLAHANSKTNQQAVAVKNKTEDSQLYPDNTFTDTWEEDIPNNKVRLHYFGAAHTNGDSFVHFEQADIVHTGDLVFNRRHPYIDRSAGANIKSWIKVLDKANDTFPRTTRFVFGHAAEGYEVTGTKEDVKSFRNYLEQLITFAEREVKAGKTQEEFLANKSIPGNTEWKGDGIERPLTAAYEEAAMK